MHWASSFCFLLLSFQLFATEPCLFSTFTPPRSHVEESQIVSFQKETELSNREYFLIQHVIQAILKSENEESILTDEILKIEGMSSPKVRHLLNHLCALPHARYLEIGCWKGSTFIAALYGNLPNLDYAVGIDDWSEFEGPKEAFQQNCARFLPENYHFYSQDCFAAPPSQFIQGPINIYFYDGNHKLDSQELAFTYFNEIFDDLFIAIVDDWHWPIVQSGTFRAFIKLNYEILFEADLPKHSEKDLKWWNGLYVAVIRKN